MKHSLAQDRMSHILQTAFCRGMYSAHTNVTQYLSLIHI